MSSNDSDYMEDEDFGSEEPSQPSFSSPPHKQSRGTDYSSDHSETGAQILGPQDIDRKIKSAIRELTEVLSPLSSDEALILLNFFGWNLSLVQEQWFENSETVRVKAGLGSTHPHELTYTAPQQTCSICLTNSSKKMPSISSCLHGFCEPCYHEYIVQKIRDGQESVRTRCPQFKCAMIVPQSMIQTLIPTDDDLYEKFVYWQRLFFVSLSGGRFKWCPNPAGCGRVVSRPSNPVVRCLCGYQWCFSCSLELHDPVSCVLSKKWSEKNSSESENVTWILANTKPCPRCHKPIEKNQGCNHMVCPPRSGGCGADFCWMCLQDWRTHSNVTGGYYKCNLYTVGDLEEKRKESKAQLDRYMFFFSRFMNHHKAQLLAEKELREQSVVWIEDLHARFDLEITDLEFIQEALKQVASCRHVLKYTYVYGYYLTDDNGLFEYLQKNLEEFTDRLHEYIEKDLSVYLEKEDGEAGENKPSVEELKSRFAEFRATVTNQSSVTKKFFKQIVEELTKRNVT